MGQWLGLMKDPKKQPVMPKGCIRRLDWNWNWQFNHVAVAGETMDAGKDCGKGGVACFCEWPTVCPSGSGDCTHWAAAECDDGFCGRCTSDASCAGMPDGKIFCDTNRGECVGTAKRSSVTAASELTVEAL